MVVLNMLILHFTEVQLIGVLNFFVFILGNQCLRRQPFDRLDHSRLSINNLVGNLLSPLMLNVINVFVEDLG